MQEIDHELIEAIEKDLYAIEDAIKELTKCVEGLGEIIKKNQNIASSYYDKCSTTDKGNSKEA